MAEPSVWFITGATTGFGRLLTEYLLGQGYRVIATLLEPEVLFDLVGRYPSTQLVVVKLDVTQHNEISRAFSKAQEVFGHVDVVFNNAGRMINGEVESVDEEKARAIFDVNFWGAAWVSREAVRFFRDVNQPRGGRLLQVSSGLGIASRACFGHYSASKFALEALTEALVDELDPAWNIKVTIFELGPFRTNLMTTNNTIIPPHPAYLDPVLKGSKWRAIISASIQEDGDPQKACIMFEKASRVEDPPLRLPLHERALGMLDRKGKSLIEAAERYKHWSNDLYL